MNGTKVRKSMAMILMAFGWAGAANKAALTTDKEVYLKYQPVYLGIQPEPDGESIAIHPNSLESGDLVLEITPPDGKTYLYRPPMTVCYNSADRGPKGKSASHTLVVGGGKVITEVPGTYVLQLLDAGHSRISAAKKFDVVEPAYPEDKRAAQEIARSPSEYALFTYLEGGDHLGTALDIAGKLAESKSAYGPTARAVLAINYSQSFTRGRDGKPRERNLAKAEKYLVDSFDDVNDYLKGRMLLTAGREFGKSRLTPAMRTRLQSAKRKWSGNRDLMRNDMIREVIDF